MSETLNRLTTISKYGGIGANVLMILMIIAAVAAVIALAAVAVNADLIIDLVERYGGVWDLPISKDRLAPVAAALIPCVIIILSLIIAILYFVARLLTNIHENNTPFTDENADTLVKIAILTLICTIVIPILDFAIQRMIDSGYYQSYGFGLFPLFVAGLLYLLSLVFKHGAELQKEADETL
ncbi:MAG: DUF2975 domain-containing protein [Methanomassiliicoccaceae archaeon]|nr:DUF2975 domain-containing protein [Methanomassiliicoccaceae archaeon]